MYFTAVTLEDWLIDHKCLSVGVFVREGSGGGDGRLSGVSFKMCKWRIFHFE